MGITSKAIEIQMNIAMKRIINTMKIYYSKLMNHGQ